MSAMEPEDASGAGEPGAPCDAPVSLDEGVAILDARGFIVAVNPAMEKFCGYGVGELAGLPIGNILATVRDAEGASVTWHALRGLAGKGGTGSLAVSLLHRDAGELSSILSAAFVGGQGGERRSMVVVMRDQRQPIAPQDGARRREDATSDCQEHIRSLGSVLGAFEEEDRRRLASHLHDTAIQSLALANIRLGAVREALVVGNDAPATLRKLDGARELLREGIKQCRLVMSDLSPLLLHQLGLLAALLDLADRLGTLYGVAVRVREVNAGAMSKEVREVLYRSARELVTNALKHSGATDVDVTLFRREGQVGVNVSDNGCGFDVGAMELRQGGAGFGLLSARERVESVGGNFEVRSAPGKGCEVVLSVPLI